MGETYLWIKLLHIFVAVVALGTSAGLGIVLEFYGCDAKHGPFVLRAIERMTALVVLPGYFLMLATGLWLANSAWSFAVRWIQLALGLWVVGLVCLAGALVIVRMQRRLHDAGDQTSARYRWTSIASRISGGAFGLVVVGVMYLMVIKP